MIIRSKDFESSNFKLPEIASNIKTNDLCFLEQVLGCFAKGCSSKVPIYGCSAYEYIATLSQFIKVTPENKNYQYIVGHTDIIAGQMAGLSQPDGKAALFINDAYGFAGLGETIRMVLSSPTNGQLLVFIWYHPESKTTLDLFAPHRNPFQLSNEIFNVSLQSCEQVSFFEYGVSPVKDINEAILKGTRLVFIHMTP